MSDRDKVIAVTKDGTPITEALADELAREAEAGYDLSLGRRVGRRSLAGDAGSSPRVSFRITRELQDRALERAEHEGKTLSELARDALAAYVGR